MNAISFTGGSMKASDFMINQKNIYAVFLATACVWSAWSSPPYNAVLDEGDELVMESTERIEMSIYIQLRVARRLKKPAKEVGDKHMLFVRSIELSALRKIYLLMKLAEAREKYASIARDFSDCIDIEIMIGKDGEEVYKKFCAPTSLLRSDLDAQAKVIAELEKAVDAEFRMNPQANHSTLKTSVPNNEKTLGNNFSIANPLKEDRSPTSN